MSRISAFILRYLNIYRVVVAIGFIVAVILALAAPAHMTDPDDWAYYYAIKNFAQGKFTVTGQEQQQQLNDAHQQRGQLIQYVELNGDKYAFEKAPGYVFYEIPFQLLGIPRWGNVLLALGMIITTYILLKRIRDEKAAMICCLLMLFTPVEMIMLNRTYMDTYASLAFLVMGGCLYIYHQLERKSLSPGKSWAILFMAFFFISYSVISRYTNSPVAAVFAVHYAVMRFIEFRKKDQTPIKRELLPVLLGIGLPLAGFLCYNWYVFGSPLDYGYHYTRFPINFAFQYLGRTDQGGQSLPLQIILGNLNIAPRSLILGFPLLIVGIPGIISALYFKFAAMRNRKNNAGNWSSLNKELPWDILMVIIGWFVFVFFLYLMYEWTAGFGGRGGGGGNYITFDRFYLPGLFPVAVICALVMARFPFKLYIPALAIIVAFGAILYAQFAFNVNILPAWLFGGGSGGPGGPGGGPGGMPGDRFPGGQPGGFPQGNPPDGAGGFPPSHVIRR